MYYTWTIEVDGKEITVTQQDVDEEPVVVNPFDAPRAIRSVYTYLTYVMDRPCQEAGPFSPKNCVHDIKRLVLPISGPYTIEFKDGGKVDVYRDQLSHVIARMMFGGDRSYFWVSLMEKLLALK